MNTDETLARYDRELRLRYRGDGPGDLVERAGGVVRQVGGGWCGVLWSDLDEAGADAEIAAQVAYFGGLGREFEWKLYGHDRPADLGVRLSAAGLVPDATETLMVAEVAGLPTEPRLPGGVRIEPVTDPAGMDRLIEAHDLAFGQPAPRLAEYLREAVVADPDALTALVVMAGDRPVCAARMDFPAGTAFAGLWGGGTVPEWRGRGIYRATVAYRAGLAAARGRRYLHVDASEQSRPILAALGFHALTTTTPYLWSAPEPEQALLGV